MVIIELAGILVILIGALGGSCAYSYHLGKESQKDKVLALEDQVSRLQLDLNDKRIDTEGNRADKLLEAKKQEQ